MIKSQEKRDDLKITCTQIFHKKDEIMKVGIQKDFLEKQGFTYSDNTFDDLFVHGWKGIHGNNENQNNGFVPHKCIEAKKICKPQTLFFVVGFSVVIATNIDGTPRPQ